MSEESLEQPSLLKHVPSITTGGTSLPLPTHELTREQVVEMLDEVVNDYFDSGGGWAASGGLSERLSRFKAHDASQRQRLAELEQIGAGLAASQCEDPIAGEYGHMLCGRVLELERQLAAAQAEVERLTTLQAIDLTQVTDEDIAWAQERLKEKADG